MPDANVTRHGVGPLQAITPGPNGVDIPIFTLLALISAPAAFNSGDKIVIVAWIAQTFLQLVLLPIIIVGQNVIQAANDARAEADHETLIAIHELTKAIDDLQLSQLEILKKLDSKP